MELARQLTWSEQQGRLYHYRTKDKLEVDAVIETPDGRVIGVEVKASATVRTDDLAGLRNLAELLGDRFIAGLCPLHRITDPAFRRSYPRPVHGRAVAPHPLNESGGVA